MADTPAPGPDPALDPGDLAAPRPKKRRWLRRLILALVLLPVIALIAIVVVIATLPTWVTPERVRQEAITAAQEALGVPVDIAALDYHPSWGLKLRGLRVGPPAGFTRDVLQLAGLDLLWVMPWRTAGAVVIERAALVEPHVVVETVNGVRNLDVLFPPSTEPKPPEAPSKPLEGRLSPVHVILREAAVERARVELVGEGPQADLQGLSVRLSAEVDEQLQAGLVITASAAPGTPNVTARVPRPDLPDQRVATELSGRIEATVRAHGSNGLQLELVTFETRLRAAHLDLFGEPPLPPATIAFEAGARLDAAADTFVIDRIALGLDQRELLRVGARVDGVVAAVSDALPLPGPLLASLGLRRSTRPEATGRVTVTGPGLVLALDPLAPYLKPFAPGLDVSGEARLVIEDVTGHVHELMAARPRSGGVRLELDHLEIRDAASQTVVGDLHGQLGVRARGAEPIAIAGRIEGRAVRSGPAVLDTFTLTATGALERPAYPQTGSATIAVSLALAGVRSPAARIDALTTTLRLRGRDPLDPARSPVRPVMIGVGLATRGLQAGTGTAAQTIGSLHAQLDATLDRLLAPSVGPIRARLTGTLEGIDTAPAEVRKLELAVDTTVDDPRHGRLLAVSLDGRLGVEGARTPDATVSRAAWSIRTRLTGVDPTGRDPLPATATIDTTLEVPAFALAAPSTLSTHARIDAQVDFTKAGEIVTIRSLRARLGDVVDATLGGRVDRALSPTPGVDVRFALAPLDLGRPVVAKMLGEPFSGKGTVAFDARAKGRWTGTDDLLARLDAPPLEVHAALTLDGVSASLPQRQIEAADLTGKMTVALSKADSGTRGELRIGKLFQGAQGARDLSSTWALGLEEGVWRARLALQAAHLGDATHSVEAATVDVDVVHPPFGDVLVRSFAIRAPGAGVEATLDGRLARGRFGAVLPQIELISRLDFDRLKSVFGDAVPPSLRDCSGALGFELGAHAPRDTEIEITGALTLDHFGWRGGDTQVVDATGRVPFAQTIYVDEPSDRLLAGREKATSVLAEGGLGLQRSLNDLVDALQRRGKLVLSSNDVLVISPRTADYESLRPYYRSRASAKLSIAELAYQHYRMTAVSMDTSYANGVFAVDRFAMSLWGGALFGEMAFQIAEEDHLRVRLRGTMTDINLDIPSAAGTGREPRLGADADPYTIAGNLDVRLDLRDRALDAYFDFTKMGKEVLVGVIIDGMDPERKSAGLQQTRATLNTYMGSLALWAGVRFDGTVMTIRNNLLDIDLKYAYEPFDLPGSLFPPLLVLRLVGGPVLMRTLSTAMPKGYSLSNYLEAPWVKNTNDAVFVDALRGRLVVEDQDALARGEWP